ncbi:N-acyl homoserine lactonase family protein [Petralouisia muris]|uniref:N-acyl homoserine lactonase family protein n=1 Tax=Petralouisia muris TaxID=3032872 RepID=A0AC61RNQ6_9FIRM|nr:N-acyl homoserine lactonase family protein [Petralouisia muris]TGY87715.1 N-acyl homoserine lactonase family protein [Petralouisia muris]
MKISVLYLGRLECKKYHLVECDDHNEMIKSPILSILIEHPVLGNILYDTGNSPYYTTEYPSSTLETYPIAEFISVEEALKEKGLTTADIDMIIMSHLHFDHAGGLKYFAGTKAIKNVFVSEAELKNAFCQVMTGQPGAYVKSLFDLKDIQFKTINEETELAEDIRLFIQNSHTPGVVGMALETKSRGNIIVTSDTIYTKESYLAELPPGGPINKTRKEFYDNLNRVKAMEKEYSAALLFGHDYEQVLEWNKIGFIE